MERVRESSRSDAHVDNVDLVGRTPMVRLGRLSPAGGAEIWAKLELLNPRGNIKDRAALGIVLDARILG
jgi:cysteine synthase A